MIGKEIHGLGYAQDGITYRLYEDDLGLDLWRSSGPIIGMHPDLHGTDGNDTFAGTDGDDHYLGLGGDDVISGAAGKDHLSGGDGNDMIKGGDGRDHLSGGDGDDILYGDNGDDVIKLGEGQAIAHGGGGNDRIEDASDEGGAKLYGGSGNDLVFGIDSTLHGGSGDDDLSGSGSKLFGGAGNDVLRIINPFSSDTYTGVISGGSGSNIFHFGNNELFVNGGKEEIRDLTNDDRIDLSFIDAKPSRFHQGDQAFRLVPKFDGHAGEMTVTYDAAHDRTLIQLYTDTDHKPDATIWAPGNHADFTNFTL